MSEQPMEPPASTGPVKFEKWTWTLFTNVRESAVELWRDDEHRLTIPLSAGQVEQLLGHPHTLASAMEGFPGLANDEGGGQAMELDR
jgi:hypothetical protein